MKLSQFIVDNLEAILVEWESFARTLLPGAEAMSKSDLRDHAREILEALALDLETDQSRAEQVKKSKGLAPVPRSGGKTTAASTHGRLRQASGFTLLQLTAEFRALRASVLRLWLEDARTNEIEAVDDLVRFNEGIDQALAESVLKFAEHGALTRDTFLAILGHDLRGPLASMALAGDYLIRAGAPNPDIKGMGQRVKRNAATMSFMVKDLLEFARIQLGGTMPLRPQASDLRTVARASLSDAGAIHPEARFEVQADGELEGYFDAVRIQQVVTNLLSNAAQYGDKQGRVVLSLMGEGDHLVLTVRNRGPVIPATAFEAIFDPMVQLAHDGRSDDRPSTSMGLGLFIAREIIDAHDGNIAVTSTEADGTTFTLKFPRKADSLRHGALTRAGDVAPSVAEEAGR